MTNIITIESVHAVRDDKNVLTSIVMRDPVSRKHLVYMVSEANSEDIVKLIGVKQVIAKQP